MGKMQKYLAEALGTFTLVGVGSFAIFCFGISSPQGVGLGYVSIAVGFGLALMMGLYAFGEVSGGHFNPAVSISMYLDRRITLDDLVGYVIAQFVGAIAASLLLLIAIDQAAVENTVTRATDTWAAIVVEFTFTALFVAVILQSSKSERVQGTALLAIPFALVAIHVAAIPISGASVNPARSFGPALVGTDFSDLWIYLIFPPLGAIVGWMIHKIVVVGDTNLRDDIDAARRRPGAETPPPTAS